jgi:hypothetical protein
MPLELRPPGGAAGVRTRLHDQLQRARRVVARDESLKPLPSSLGIRRLPCRGPNECTAVLGIRAFVERIPRAWTSRRRIRPLYVPSFR